ncbi:hypothetical protein ACJRO7_026734 [Eucalyptus globulus]|uniref:mitogen-activated protein kinase kinase kinase n=1 Tax=Eucalyptus globulus TaxID=34317 RepID=A0ABD3JP95_EUCGL
MRTRRPSFHVHYSSSSGSGRFLQPHQPPWIYPRPSSNRSRYLLNSFCPQEGLGGEEDSPVRPLNKEDRSDGDDEKVSQEGTSSGKDDSLLSTAEEESHDKYDVGNILSADISEPVHTVSPCANLRRRITSWQKGELLGSGSFGTVYEGISDDGFFFAIKEVSLLDQGSRGEEMLLQLEKEISLLSQFDHENIVRYIGTDKDDKKLYVFLELMTKGSLASLYHKHKLRDSQVSSFTRQILNAHVYNFNNIKCANILVNANGSVKLADFGLAKATEMNAAKTSLGSTFWMAPEVVNPKGRSSELDRSNGLEVDIWSLGCTVLEMLTRQRPYPKLDKMQALFRIGRGEPPPIPDSLSRDARDFILRCLEVNLNNRPSAADLLDDPFVRKPPASSGFASARFNNISS